MTAGDYTKITIFPFYSQSLVVGKYHEFIYFLFGRPPIKHELQEFLVVRASTRVQLPL